MELDSPPPALYAPVFPKLDLIVCHISDTQAGTVIPSWSRTFYIDLCVKVLCDHNDCPLS